MTTKNSFKAGDIVLVKRPTLPQNRVFPKITWIPEMNPYCRKKRYSVVVVVDNHAVRLSPIGFGAASLWFESAWLRRVSPDIELVCRLDMAIGGGDE